MWKGAFSRSESLFYITQRSFRLWTSKQQNSPCIKEEPHLKKCYLVLGLSSDCSDVDLKDTYLSLAKVYHPDSGSASSDPEKFTQIDMAYKTVLQHRQECARIDDIYSQVLEEQNEPDFNIKHTVPQHRQYLDNEGIGFGTPQQRKKQFDLYKVHRANDNINEYKVNKLTAPHETSMVVKDKKQARKIVIRNAIDRLVEDLISESMSKGEFDDLPGKGKPLEYSVHNPMVDSTTHNLNKVLINNGYAPEWITLEKEIRSTMKELRDKLLSLRVSLGPEMSREHKKLWESQVTAFKEDVESINRKVDKFNLTVPYFWKQLVHYNQGKEVKKVLERYKEGEHECGVDLKTDVTRHTAMFSNDSKPIAQQDIVVPSVSFKGVFTEIKALFRMV